MSAASVDTDVLIRYITGDDAAKPRAAAALLRRVRRNRVFRPAAHNLLEGSIDHVREFLDELAAVEDRIPPDRAGERRPDRPRSPGAGPG
jgi:hypothetical protein